MISSKHKICRPPAAGRHAPGFIAKRGAVLSSVLLLVRDNGVVCGLEWRPSSEATRARLESPLLNLTGRLENGRSQRGGAGFFRNPIVSEVTESADFATTPPAFQPRMCGSIDAVVTKTERRRQPHSLVHILWRLQGKSDQHEGGAWPSTNPAASGFNTQYLRNTNQYIIRCVHCSLLGAVKATHLNTISSIPITYRCIGSSHAGSLPCSLPRLVNL
jgi:hypothetical protein